MIDPALLNNGPIAEKRLVDLNFKVSEQFRRRIRIEAAKRGVSMRDLMEKSVIEHLRRYPTPKP